MAEVTRVLQIIDAFEVGGAETLLCTLAEGIDRTQFELHMLALRPLPDSPVAHQLREIGVPVTELNQRNSYDIPALLQIVRYVRRHRIDVIHTHLMAADIMGRMAGFLTRRPVVSTIHNNRADFDKEPRRRRMLERWTARLYCSRIIVVAENLRGEIAGWFGVPLDRVASIPNGVHTERFAFDSSFDRTGVKRSLSGGDFRLVTTVGRLVPQKAQSYFIEAAAIVSHAQPAVRFILLGDGPLREDLEGQAARLGMADKVVVTGFRTDVAEVLGASEVFVLSSLWEGLPVSLLEALAAGCPVVCTAVGGVPRVIQEGVTGLLVPPADAQALASAILKYLEEPELAARMGNAGREWVKREYDIGRWVGDLEALYRQQAVR